MQVIGLVLKYQSSIIFQFRLFPGKTNEIFFSKNSQNPIIRPFSAFFAQILTEMNFSGKRALSVSEYSSYLPPCKKEKIIMTHSWKTDRETFLWKKVLPVSEYSSYLPLCKKSKKNNDPFLKQPDRQADLFLEKRALSASEYSSYLPSCKKSETNNDPFLIQTDRQTFFWKDGGQKKKERKKEKTLQ